MSGSSLENMSCPDMLKAQTCYCFGCFSTSSHIFDHFVHFSVLHCLRQFLNRCSFQIVVFSSLFRTDKQHFWPLNVPCVVGCRSLITALCLEIKYNLGVESIQSSSQKHRPWSFRPSGLPRNLWPWIHVPKPSSPLVALLVQPISRWDQAYLRWAAGRFRVCRVETSWPTACVCSPSCPP